MSEVTEYELLKQQLTERGITFKANASKATLEKLLQEADKAEEVQEANATLSTLISESTKLIRCIITPNDPIKQQMGQEYFGTGNSVMGTISRMVVFGEEWHVEKMLLDIIKSKQYQFFVPKKNDKGDVVMVSKVAPAYNVQELPPLTKEELNELAKNQRATESLMVD